MRLRILISALTAAFSFAAGVGTERLLNRGPEFPAGDNGEILLGCLRSESTFACFELDAFNQALEDHMLERELDSYPPKGDL